MAALDGAATAAVVDQRVDGLLQHSFFVADYDFWSSQRHEPLQPVVPVDHPAVEVVQVAGGEPAAIQLHHGAQLGRQDGQHRDNHIFNTVAAFAEGLHYTETFDGFFPALTGCGMHLIDQLVSERFQVDGFKDGQDGFGAHVRFEHIAIGLFQLPVAGLGDELVDPEVFEFVDGGFELLIQLTFFRGQLIGYGINLNLDGDRIHLHFRLFELNWSVIFVTGAFRRLRGCFSGNIFDCVFGSGFRGVFAGRFIRVFLGGFIRRCQTAIQAGFQCVGPGLGLPARLLQFQVELGMLQLNGFQTHVFVHRHYDVLGEVEHPFQVPGRQVQKETQPTGRGLAEPDVGHGRCQPNMAHAFTAHLGPCDLDTATVADHAAVADAFVFAAEALPVLGGAEQPLTEETILLRAQGAVVDRLRLGYLAVRPVKYLFRGCNGDADRVEVSACGGFRPIYHSDH